MFYMKIKDIDGGTSTKGYENWIELTSIDFELSRKIHTKVGNTSDREGSTPKIDEFIVTKPLDKSSPYLFEEGCTGLSLGKVEIHACGASDTSKYLQYTLSDVIVSHYGVSGMIDQHLSNKPEEILHLNFTKIEMKYIPYDIKNKALAPISTGYDSEKATKL